jgi:hypothetical protein
MPGKNGTGANACTCCWIASASAICRYSSRVGGDAGGENRASASRSSSGLLIFR